MGESTEADSTKIEEEAPIPTDTDNTEAGSEIPVKPENKVTEEKHTKKTEKLKDLLGDINSKIAEQILVAQTKLNNIKDGKKSKNESGNKNDDQESEEQESPKRPSEHKAANLVAAAENKTKKALGNARDAFKKAASKVGLFDEEENDKEDNAVPGVIEVKENYSNEANEGAKDNEKFTIDDEETNSEGKSNN